MCVCFFTSLDMLITVPLVLKQRNVKFISLFLNTQLTDTQFPAFIGQMLD